MWFQYHFLPPKSLNMLYSTWSVMLFALYEITLMVIMSVCLLIVLRYLQSLHAWIYRCLFTGYTHVYICVAALGECPVLLYMQGYIVHAITLVIGVYCTLFILLSICTYEYTNWLLCSTFSSIWQMILFLTFTVFYLLMARFYDTSFWISIASSLNVWSI